MTELELRQELQILYDDKCRDAAWFKRYWEVIRILRSLEKPPGDNILQQIEKMGLELVHLPMDCGKWIQEELVVGLFRLVFGKGEDKDENKTL